MVGQKLGVLQVSMVLDLVDSWFDGAVLQDSLKVLWQVVRHADGFGKTLGLDFFHFFPCLLLLFLRLGEEWSMDQVAATC